ncbi:helix-turn-helix domain-containing protein [Streptomyces sp. H10-C2]|uniref:helix-turn-helix domain-containing protein n=1 Tax=unclassified Streptomyces TaxID=2593676 RepID=UPI0024B9F1A3|nr:MULTISPECIES: helix-turn-helix domain-containing protein [unclassified Streptomyces]MDJ0346338.1 helix-turn-helix domain-containing protein [Streptomyces sp. PH10-H1]MDJ0370775.1 helix-turn-helix domain-containing protein [Streptomyces sp. H10-C2]
MDRLLSVEQVAEPLGTTARLHRVEVVARILGVARSTVYEEIRLGRLRTVQIGRRRLVPTEYVDAYVELLKGEALAEDTERPWLRIAGKRAVA